eukprot:ctg_824.g277
MQDALRGLESAQRVEQERALQAVRAVLPAAAAELEAARGWCERVLDAESPCWASVCGVFRLGQLVLEQQFGRGAAIEDDALAKRQWQSLMERGALLYMEHTEARVRQAAMAALAAVVRCDDDDQVLRRALPLLLSSVERNLPRKVSNGSAEGEGDASSGVRSATESADTGWHALETSLNGAAECVVALSAAGVVRLAPDLERLFAGEALQHCRRHPNRFVREADLRLVESVLRALTQLPDDAAARRTVTHVADSSLAIIAAGLADNWSQVRYMASKAARALYQVQRQSGAQHGDRIDRVLVPRMCLNRHYVAEGRARAVGGAHPRRDGVFRGGERGRQSRGRADCGTVRVAHAARADGVFPRRQLAGARLRLYRLRLDGATVWSGRPGGGAGGRAVRAVVCPLRRQHPVGAAACRRGGCERGGRSGRSARTAGVVVFGSGTAARAAAIVGRLL